MIVIGAGAIGTSIAYQLAKAGVRVTVVDRGQVGGGATGASAGMIQVNPDCRTPTAVTTLEAESARLFPALTAELRERTGMDVGYRPLPLLHLALHAEEEPSLRAHRGLLSFADVRVSRRRLPMAMSYNTTSPFSVRWIFSIDRSLCVRAIAKPALNAESKDVVALLTAR